MSMGDATRVLGVHASPASDDGDGINNDIADDGLAALFEGCKADVVIGGHTHDPTDRSVGSLRALNPGSASMPRHGGGACWMLVDDEAGDGIRVEHRRPAFDVETVIEDMKQRRHPNADFIAGVLRRTQRFGR
jgi:diadenosine tetraphosphatase ApaH/serine/threonine PP2A family protein phosphatase